MYGSNAYPHEQLEQQKLSDAGHTSMVCNYTAPHIPRRSRNSIAAEEANPREYGEINLVLQFISLQQHQCWGSITPVILMALVIGWVYTVAESRTMYNVGPG